jgi:hypothetical protein
MLRDTLLARLAQAGEQPDYSRIAADVLGIHGAPAVLARRLVEQALVVEDRHEHWRRVGDRACHAAPDSPGVYVFRDADRRSLYVGQASNLRRRLRGHFGDRRWRALRPIMARVADVEWQIVGSEIEGWLREAILIRTLRPVANVQIAPPTLETRLIPRALVRDVLLVLPSTAPESAELIAATVGGRVLQQRTARADEDCAGHAERLWSFFQGPSDESEPAVHEQLAPLVFSWLARRGARATRLDPHAADSVVDFKGRLVRLLTDKDLFTERLITV